MEAKKSEKNSRLLRFLHNQIQHQILRTGQII